MRVFSELTPDRLDLLDSIYAVDARFTDPFNAVQGRVAIRRIFAHMYGALDTPHFVITQRVTQDQHCVLLWNFVFCLRGARTAESHCIPGATHLLRNDSGRIADHRDYWDAAELYEKLPLVGGPMRWLRRRAAT